MLDSRLFVEAVFCASESPKPPGRSHAGVRVGPGETQLERTPAGPNSMLIAFDIISTAALEML